ncbi:class I SAM-dependent methyltransferase [Alkalicoccobacillus porphyridii]|uniref:Class I SAM-dependent methyltransferase n=1 Tax=Alkalicoccobacillus porphyridii TaxID=2597270 RepID=A0A553ZWZ8_9BACI|nr:class I SAM-dependent methyltransferase [Alkalicoccobacillus porphyridii]TSB45974.1 class I SAM-dependent methyltransferase [Alkalicoccobacillus porphyridii]
MKQNKYDDEDFFRAYENMPRSVHGLTAAGEWHVLQKHVPNLKGKRVLDLGCGFGWHCRYAVGKGAAQVTGIDISNNMLEKAKTLHSNPSITYIQRPIEEAKFASNSFDVVISSLAFHYVKAYRETIQRIYQWLSNGGTLLFTVEHPIFTAREEQDWIIDEQGTRSYWPIDDYQQEGKRITSFLTKDVVKYHRTISTYTNELIRAGFVLQAIEEPKPTKEALQQSEEMKDELRRPMFLMMSAKKQEEERH